MRMCMKMNIIKRGMLGSMMRSVLILISMLHVSSYLWASNISDNEPDIEKTLILRDTL